MAIKKKPASKPAGNAKKTVVAKKAAPAKKVAAPVKKAPPAKKAAPVKKAVPAKKVVAPAKKATPAKKAAPIPKAAPAKKAAPVKKVVAPVKKAAPAKKAVVPAKKVAPAKKVVAPVKKAAPAKPVKKVAAPVKKAAPAPVKKVIAKVPAKSAAPVKSVKEHKEVKQKPTATSAKKTASVATTTKILKSIVNNSSGTPVHPTKPTPAPVGRSLREEKKAQVIVAHRRLQSEFATKGDSKNSFNEFNRSLLDEQPSMPTVGKRYSDEDLAEFREIINTRLENARKELAYLQGLIMRKDGAGTEDSENRFNAEDGSGAMERETVSQLASRQIQFITNLEKALIRIENKTYGVCRVTGKLIDKARLRAVPHATLSIEAKTTMKK